MASACTVVSVTKKVTTSSNTLIECELCTHWYAYWAVSDMYERQFVPSNMLDKA